MDSGCLSDNHLTLNKTYLYHSECINNFHNTHIHHRLNTPGVNYLGCRDYVHIATETYKKKQSSLSSRALVKMSTNINSQVEEITEELV